MNDSGCARITDFGEATLVKDENSVESDPDVPAFTLRWAAPEVLEGGIISKKADIFSFVMLIIEESHR